MVARLLGVVTLLGLFAAGPGGCLYTGVTMPLAYRSPTPGDVGGTAHLGPEVRGRACNHAVLDLVAWGDGGYAKALANAKLQAGPDAVLADVQADTKFTSVLSIIYQRQCTEVSARVVR